MLLFSVVPLHVMIFESKEDKYFVYGLKGMKDEGFVKYTRLCFCKLRFLDTIWLS